MPKMPKPPKKRTYRQWLYAVGSVPMPEGKFRERIIEGIIKRAKIDCSRVALPKGGTEQQRMILAHQQFESALNKHLYRTATKYALDKAGVKDENLRKMIYPLMSSLSKAVVVKDKKREQDIRKDASALLGDKAKLFFDHHRLVLSRIGGMTEEELDDYMR